MSEVYERLAEIKARADHAIDALAPYVEDYRPREEAVEDILYRTAASSVPSLVAALEAVLNILYNEEDGDPPDPVLRWQIEEAIENHLKEKS